MDTRELEKLKILKAEKNRLENYMNTNPGRDHSLNLLKVQALNNPIWQIERKIVAELNQTYIKDLISAESLADQAILEESLNGTK